MKLKKPKFWDYEKPNVSAYLLWPISIAIKFINYLRANIKNKKKYSSIKTICIGNIYLGGTRKTSLCLKINKFLDKANIKSCFIKKYYTNQLDEQRILENNGRLFKSKKRNVEYIKVRAFDACTFVAFGAAQIGIAGEDVINEFDYSEIYAPLDLNIGYCRISVAALKSLLKKEDPETWSNIRIATKYPNITKKFFYNKGIQVEIIKLSG